MARREDRDVSELAQRHAGQRIDAADAVDLVAEELDAHHILIRVYRPDLDRVAAHAEAIALEGDVVALILDVDQAADERIAPELHARTQRNDHALVVDRVAERIDARHRGHDDNVAALGERGGRGMAQAVDLVVDSGVLLDIGIGRSDVRLRLIVIIVGDEILDGVVREEFAQLGAQLRGERFIVREHERRALCLLDDVSHGEGLARAGNALERLLLQTVADALDELRDRLRLVARHPVRAYDVKFRHFARPPSVSLICRGCAASPGGARDLRAGCPRSPGTEQSARARRRADADSCPSRARRATGRTCTYSPDTRPK